MSAPIGKTAFLAEAGMFNAGRLALIFNLASTAPLPAGEPVGAGQDSDRKANVRPGPPVLLGRIGDIVPLQRKVKVLVDFGESGKGYVEPPPPPGELTDVMTEEFYVGGGTRLLPPWEQSGEPDELGRLPVYVLEKDGSRHPFEPGFHWKAERPARPVKPVGAGLPKPADASIITDPPGGSPAYASTRPARKSQSVAFLIDVAGMDESRLSATQSMYGDGLGNPGRDSTTLTIVEVDLSTLADLQRPTYRVVERHAWTGENHLAVFGMLKNLAGKWSPQHIVVDATGVWEGLWAMLDRAFPTRVIPVKFTVQEKSEIGWRFLSIIETGRFIDRSADRASSEPQLRLTREDQTLSDSVRLQYNRCICEILPGPAKILRWGVPEGARGPDGELVHDDFILADALTAKLDELEWHIHFSSVTVDTGFDPLKRLDEDYKTWGIYF